MMNFSSSPFAAFTAQMNTTTSKPKFVEGTVNELARALYAVHTENVVHPANAVQEILKTMCDDPDRAEIVQEALKETARLTRQGLTLMGSKKAQTPSIFEQAKSIKESKLSRLKRERDEANTKISSHKNKVLVGALTLRVDNLTAQIGATKEELVQAIYSKEEVAEAASRIRRIKEMEAAGGDDSEETVKQLLQTWRQLVQSLLLQKLSAKQKDKTKVTFAETPRLSKEPIAGIARYESGKLGRLDITEGESILSFCSRCRAEELFCDWLHKLHTSPGECSAEEVASIQSRSRDADEALFQAVARVLPSTYAFIRTTVEKESEIGRKFQNLRIALEGESQFLKEVNPTHKNRVTLIDTEVASVALTTRLAKDPNSKVVRENHSESYKKVVSTDFEPQKSNKKSSIKRASIEEEDGEEQGDKVLTISETPTDIDEDDAKTMLQRILTLITKEGERSTSRQCFQFASKGKCLKANCPYLHDAPSRSKNTRERSLSPERKARGRARSRSPRHGPRHRSPPPPSSRRSGKGGRRYPQPRPANGHTGSQRHNPREPTIGPGDCKDMFHTSRCGNKNCRDYHGRYKSAGEKCNNAVSRRHCPHLWGEGCRFYHSTKNE